MIGGETSYSVNIGAMLVAESDAASTPADAIDLAGGRIVRHSDWTAATQELAQPMRIDLLVIEAVGVDDAVLETALPLLDRLAARQHARIVATIGAGQIDLVTRHLFGRHVQLLCDPTLTDRVAALAIAGGVRLDRHVGEIGQDAQALRLRRLNEEVARIAETLARLTRDDAGLGERPTSSLGDRRFGYGAPPSDDGIGPQDLRQAIRARRLRGQFFEQTLLEDPAWDMLLDLYAAELERAQVSVSSLCIAAAVAPTTALRWIAKMTEAGLLERHPDPFDRRRAFMALSTIARDGLRGYFAAARRAGLSIA